ncbi:MULTISPECIES: S-type pyocin domain-containing protein [Pseudomonas]|uniref:Pyosin/cloacin translocation domain-containing protein n=1 Tax=Pseudomonas quercus TaxID=2722792 RepID=A0ABX0YGF5_9PSED|nr:MULTISPECIES: S-type pyocin domain-containing protein [Pseudomonas]MBF7142550.1 S-type pyocin domain-containing protein [Pseudomonas sp. LY10J]NJP01088.1 hypothetical protein [Pseudomonas quercus]
MLKERYEDYTEQEFLAVCEQVFWVKGDAAAHEALIAELDALVDAPDWDLGLVFASGRPFTPSVQTPAYLMANIKACRGRLRPGLKPGGSPASEPPLVPIDGEMIQREGQRAEQLIAGRGDASLGRGINRLIGEERMTERELIAGFAHLEQIRSLIAQGPPQDWPSCMQLRSAVNSLGHVLYSLVPTDRFTSFSRRLMYDLVEARNINRPSPMPAQGWDAWVAQGRQWLALHDGRMKGIEASITHLMPAAQAALAEGALAWVRATSALRKANTLPLEYEIPLADATARPLICHPVQAITALLSAPESQLSLLTLSAVASYTAGTNPAWSPATCSYVYEFGREAWRGDPYLVMAPFEVLAPTLDSSTLHQGRVTVPYRLLMRAVDGYFRLSVCQSFAGLAREVPVLECQALPEQEGYTLTLPTGETLRWQAALPLLSRRGAYTGELPRFKTAGAGRWFEPQPVSPAALKGYREYVVRFPEGSGIAPLYLSRTRLQDTPGIATGAGLASEEGWLTSVASGGAGLPSVLTAPLAGQAFEEFAALERAIWRSMAAVPALAAQFNDANLALMAQGLAPQIESSTLALGHREEPDYHRLYELNELWFTLG